MESESDDDSDDEDEEGGAAGGDDMSGDSDEGMLGCLLTSSKVLKLPQYISADLRP